MKHLGLLAVLFFGLNHGHAQMLASEHTFIYWMPYDNNLSDWADSIYTMIDEGLVGEDIVVTIQKDQLGPGGMTRSILSKKRKMNSVVKDENSWSGQSYNDYLEWVYDKVSSKKYSFIFLDHGGGLDEVGLDEYPTKQFLRIDSIRMAIDNFNAKIGKKAELIYLQVCTKGSIEPIYELKDLSHFTLFSQTVLGAPNFYYTGFYKWFSSQEVNTLNGLQIADAIIANEHESMYQSLVCIDNRSFYQFEKAFGKFLSTSASINQLDVSKNLVLLYGGEKYFDLSAFLKSIDTKQARKLQLQLNKLIVQNKVNPSNPSMKGYCGLSLLAIRPDYGNYIKKYQHLQFFQKFDTVPLYKKILNK